MAKMGLSRISCTSVYSAFQGASIPMSRRKEPVIPDVILNRLQAGSDAQSAFGSNGLLDQLKKTLAERALNVAMDHHLAGEGAWGGSGG